MTERPEHCFLLTLVDLGYVGTDARFFSLRPQVLELGYAFLSALTLPQVAEPHLEPPRGGRPRVVVGLGARRRQHRLRGAQGPRHGS